MKKINLISLDSYRSYRKKYFEVNPPPWKINPSAWRHRLPIAVLAGIGFSISAYMALFQWGLISTLWDPVFGNQSSQNVLTSDVSKTMHTWFGIPDAALGALAYLGDAIYGLAGTTRRWQYRPWMVILFGLDVIPLGLVSAVLVGMQGWVVGFWCFLCLVTALISLILVALAYDEVWSSLLYLKRTWSQHKDMKYFLNVFFGREIFNYERNLNVGTHNSTDARSLVSN